MMAEFAECVHYIPLRGNIDAKRVAKMNLEPRFISGVFLGLTDRSDEIIVWSTEGIRKARTIRRRPEEERWDREQILSVRGTPLQPNPEGEGNRIRTRMEPGVANQEIVGDPVTKEEVREALGEQRPFYMMRSAVRETAEKIDTLMAAKVAKQYD